MNIPEQLEKQAREAQELNQKRFEALIKWDKLALLAAKAKKEYDVAFRAWVAGPQPVIVGQTSLWRTEV